MKSSRTDSLHVISSQDRYPDPTADLEATLRPGARLAGAIALELAPDRKPTPEDIEIDARLQRIHDALDAGKPSQR